MSEYECVSEPVSEYGWQGEGNGRDKDVCLKGVR